VDRVVLNAMLIPRAGGAIIWDPLQEKPIHLTAMETAHLVISTIRISFVIRHSSFVVDK
jgi:hypothetical protein